MGFNKAVIQSSNGLIEGWDDNLDKDNYIRLNGCGFLKSSLNLKMISDIQNFVFIRS